MTDAASAQLPATANFINPETMHHPTGYTHVVEVTTGRPVYISGQVALPSSDRPAPPWRSGGWSAMTCSSRSKRSR